MVFFAFAALYVIWGSTYLAIRYAVETFPPFTMAGLRFLSAGAILYSWMRWRGHPSPRPREWRSAFLVGAFLLLGGNGGVSWAERTIPSGSAALLIGLVPLWMVLLEALRPGGKKPARAVVAGLVLGFAGLAILVGPGSLADGRSDTRGMLVVAGCAFSWAVGSLYARRAPLPHSILMATSLEMIGGGILLVTAGGLAGEWKGWTFGAVSAVSWAAFAYLTIVGALIGFSCYVYLLHHTTPAKASTYAFVNPVIAVLLGWAVADEPLTARTLAASSLIVLAVALIVLFRSPSPTGSPQLPEA